MGSSSAPGRAPGDDGRRDGSGHRRDFPRTAGRGAISAEVLYGSPEFEPEVIIPAGLASVVSYCTFGVYAGWEPLFSIPQLRFTNPWQLGPYAVLALWMVLLAMLYTRSFYGMTHWFHRWKITPHVKPAVGAFLTGAVGLGLYLAFKHDRSVLAVMSFGYARCNKRSENTRSWERWSCWLFR